MNRWMVLLAVVGALQSAAFAQDRIYRCGNEYTNSAVIAKQRNCQVVDGGHVTVVHSDASRPAAQSSSAAPKPSSSANRGKKVDAGQQQARDSEARQILQSELKKAKDKLDTLKAEYNDGYPVKSALELRNPQVYNERLEALKVSISRQEADVASIQRELDRHTGN